MLRFIFFLIIVVCFPAVGNESVAARLKEAQDYLTVKPSHSFDLLQVIRSELVLTEQQLIEWHILHMRVSLPLSKLDNMIDSLDELFKYQKHPYFQQNITSITSALGIWLRLNGYIEDASYSLNCAYQHAPNDKRKLLVINSLALLARQANDLEKAKSLYASVIEKARSLNDKNMLANAHHNSGLIALQEKNIPQAEQYFREALKLYQSINKRVGKVRSGTLLLLIFVLQKDELSYTRLYPTTKRLASSLSSEAYMALLQWIDAGYQDLLGNPPSIDEKQTLLALLKHFNDGDRSLVVKYLAKPLQISQELPKPQVNNTRFNRAWFDAVKQCKF